MTRPPVLCRQCGAPVPEGREHYATPMCHDCLAPPAPLPVRPPPGQPGAGGTCPVCGQPINSAACQRSHP